MRYRWPRTRTLIFLCVIMLPSLFLFLRVKDAIAQTKPTPAQKAQKIAKDVEMPIAPFVSDPGTPTRKHERTGWRPNWIKEEMPGIAETMETDTFVEMQPVLPAARSDAVVIATVTSAQAYVSSDKSAVFSEFKVVVNEILKYPFVTSLAVGDTLTAVREGGRVKFPSGRIQTYSMSGQGTLQIDKKYVLFLKYGSDSQDFLVLTGYRLESGLVTPVEKDTRYFFYKDAEEKKFLDLVRDLIANAEPTSPPEMRETR
jgi:hypothetical protein